MQCLQEGPLAKKDKGKDKDISQTPITQSITIPAPPIQALDVANAFPMRLQTLDLARHTVVALDGKRFVVATFDDTHLGHGYVTSIYPQQNGYLTLIRLMITQRSSPTPQEAMKTHWAMVEAVQQGKIDNSKNP